MVRFAPFFFFFLNFGLTWPFRLEPAISPISADTAQFEPRRHESGNPRGRMRPDARSTASFPHRCVGRECDGSGVASVHPRYEVDVYLTLFQWWISFGLVERQWSKTAVCNQYHISFSLTHSFFYFFVPIQDKILTLNIFGIIFVFCG